MLAVAFRLTQTMICLHKSLIHTTCEHKNSHADTLWIHCDTFARFLWLTRTATAWFLSTHSLGSCEIPIYKGNSSHSGAPPRREEVQSGVYNTLPNIPTRRAQIKGNLEYNMTTRQRPGETHDKLLSDVAARMKNQCYLFPWLQSRFRRTWNINAVNFSRPLMIQPLRHVRVLLAVKTRNLKLLRGRKLLADPWWVPQGRFDSPHPNRVKDSFSSIYIYISNASIFSYY
jgi:hypothetical protein